MPRNVVKKTSAFGSSKTVTRTTPNKTVTKKKVTGPSGTSLSGTKTTKTVVRNGNEVKSKVTRKRPNFEVSTDTDSYAAKGKSQVKTTGNKTKTTFKAKGTGYANPIKKAADKNVTKNGVTRTNSQKTTYRTPAKMQKMSQNKRKY